MNIQNIGENAGKVLHLLYGEHRKWEYQELREASGLSDRDLSTAIGWLARENKIQFDTTDLEGRQTLYLEQNFYIG